MMYRISKKIIRKSLKNIFFYRKVSKVFFIELIIKHYIFSFVSSGICVLARIQKVNNIYLKVLSHPLMLLFHFLIFYNKFVYKPL